MWCSASYEHLPARPSACKVEGTRSARLGAVLRQRGLRQSQQAGGRGPCSHLRRRRRCPPRGAPARRPGAAAPPVPHASQSGWRGKRPRTPGTRPAAHQPSDDKARGALNHTAPLPPLRTHGGKTSTCVRTLTGRTARMACSAAESGLYVMSHHTTAQMAPERLVDMKLMGALSGRCTCAGHRGIRRQGVTRGLISVRRVPTALWVLLTMMSSALQIPPPNPARKVVQ